MSVPTDVPADPPPHSNGGGSTFLCVACYLSSAGGKMAEAQAVLGGQSLCLDHLNAVYNALEAQPDVTPH